MIWEVTPPSVVFEVDRIDDNGTRQDFDTEWQTIHGYFDAGLYTLETSWVEEGGSIVPSTNWIWKDENDNELTMTEIVNNLIGRSNVEWIVTEGEIYMYQEDDLWVIEIPYSVDYTSTGGPTVSNAIKYIITVYAEAEVTE